MKLAIFEGPTANGPSRGKSFHPVLSKISPDTLYGKVELLCRSKDSFTKKNKTKKNPRKSTKRHGMH